MNLPDNYFDKHRQQRRQDMVDAQINALHMLADAGVTDRKAETHTSRTVIRSQILIG